MQKSFLSANILQLYDCVYDHVNLERSHCQGRTRAKTSSAVLYAVSVCLHLFVFWIWTLSNNFIPYPQKLYLWGNEWVNEYRYSHVRVKDILRNAETFSHEFPDADGLQDKPALPFLLSSQDFTTGYVSMAYFIFFLAGQKGPRAGDQEAGVLGPTS